MTHQSSIYKLRAQIEELLAESRQKTLSVKQLSQALGLQGQDSKILARELGLMLEEGLLIKSVRGHFGLPRRSDCLTGVLQGNRRGFAFLRPDGEEEDIYIRSRSLNDAVHGDRVMIRLISGIGRRREGEVIGILQRGHRRLVGTLKQQGKRCYVLPDDQRLFQEIEVSAGKNMAKPGEKVVLEIETWGRGHKLSRGKVVERLGPAGSTQAEQLSLHRKYDLPMDFPDNVLEEVKRMPGEESIPMAVVEGTRRDLRALPMVTIDGQSARDFDDAVSLETMTDGSFRLGVHIADVSYYVRAGKPLDREAFKRATSTYLVNQVIHMLPPLLSEELCSLKAGRDRLALSVFIELNREGEVAGYSLTPSVIRVTERLTYPQVEAFLEGSGDGKLLEHAFLGETLQQMGRLAYALRRRRLQRGSLDLDLPEAQIILDDDGNPVQIIRHHLGRSESLIEEFMILANETVAGHMAREKIPCLYRVHAVPTEEKLAALKETLSLLGLPDVTRKKELKPSQLKLLLESSKGKPAERLIRFLMLRSLPQARYSAENEGHFGLASSFYCHFTSPIRRYPDLVVHRILKETLAGNGLKADRMAKHKARLPIIAQQASERERAAMEVERADEELMKARYMEDKVGEVYPGLISGVANFGLFVELENTVEGMIPIADLGDDYYIYQEKQAALVGERSRKSYRLGDRIEIEVVRVNTTDGKLTFALPAAQGRAKKRTKS